jgi:Cytochrome c
MTPWRRRTPMDLFTHFTTSAASFMLIDWHEVIAPGIRQGRHRRITHGTTATRPPPCERHGPGPPTGVAVLVVGRPAQHAPLARRPGLYRSESRRAQSSEWTPGRRPQRIGSQNRRRYDSLRPHQAHTRKVQSTVSTATARDDAKRLAVLRIVIRVVEVSSELGMLQGHQMPAGRAADVRRHSAVGPIVCAIRVEPSMRSQQGLSCTALGVWIGMGLSLSPAAAASQPGHAPVSQGVVNGGVIYRHHCAVCHGDRGKGNGPAAATLTPRPTDLTRLTRQTGTFPAARLAALLKGDDSVTPHRTPSMMIWAAIFVAEASGDTATADARVRDVVEFVASIQDRH